MVNDRIEALIVHFSNGNKSLFSKEIGVSPSVIGNITGERKGNPSFEVVQKILDAFASISPDWLMFGRGSMLREEQPVAQVTAAPVISDSGEASVYYRMYKEKDEEVKAQAEEIGRLKQQLEGLVNHPRSDMPSQEDSTGSIRTRKRGVAGLESAQFAERL